MQACSSSLPLFLSRLNLSVYPFRLLNHCKEIGCTIAPATESDFLPKSFSFLLLTSDMLGSFVPNTSTAVSSSTTDHSGSVDAEENLSDQTSTPVHTVASGSSLRSSEPSLTSVTDTFGKLFSVRLRVPLQFPAPKVSRARARR